MSNTAALIHILATLEANRGVEVAVTSLHSPVITGVFSGYIDESVIVDGHVRVTVPVVDITSVRAITYASTMTDAELRAEVGGARARLSGQLDGNVRVCVQARLNTVIDEQRARKA